jgi:hypothetical protein
MNKEPAVDLSTLLPPVSASKLRPWAQAFGSDYYGALQVAAEYCGLRTVPNRFPCYCWQHGTWPPWQKIRAEVLVYNVPKSTSCLVARQDEVPFLKAGGYPSVRAIGLPIIYTKPSGLQRIPNSLLVMPTHTIPSDVLLPLNEQYVREIASIKNRFGLVAASVSANCITKGLWTSQFAEHGIPVIRGAGIDDVNSLKRMRALFDTFEYVTTDSYGSHVYYALYFGAKVSIWGTATPMLRENVLSDGAWTPYPEAVDKLFTEETERKAEMHLGPLRVDPWAGVQNVDTAGPMVGHDSKLSPREMRAAFGWTPMKILVGSTKDKASILVGSAKASVRRSTFWRAGSAAKRRLRATVKGIVG